MEHSLLVPMLRVGITSKSGVEHSLLVPMLRVGMNSERSAFIYLSPSSKNADRFLLVPTQEGWNEKKVIINKDFNHT